MGLVSERKNILPKGEHIVSDCLRGRRGLVVKASDFHAGGRGFDSRSGQAAQ